MLLLALLGTSLAGGYMVLGRIGSSRQEPRRVTIAFGEPVRKFVEANGIPFMQGQRLDGHYIDPDKTSDVSPLFLGGLITVVFEDGPQGFSLPPGRSLVVSQIAGVIQDFTMTLFDEPKPFDEAQSFMKTFVDELDRKDWRADNGVKIPARPDDLETSGAWTIIAQMQDLHANRLEIEMIDYGLAPKQESWVTVPLGRSDKASHTYLVHVSVLQPSGTFRNYGEAIYPRRLYVNGAIGKDVPLRAWIDEPDWSPAAHGMVPVPHSERKGDVSFWRMPR